MSPPVVALLALLAAPARPSLPVEGLTGVETPRPLPSFELVQPELFSAPGGQPNAWADFDGDGDLDLFVGFSRGANRLYRNDGGSFLDVASSAGIQDPDENTRAAAWGDFDADGDPDLYVGFQRSARPNRVYRNEGNGRFTDVAGALGIELSGTSRQAAWVDVDGDGDLDLFAGFRDLPNRLFRNDGDRFVDITEASGIGDPRKTVGALFWDFDADGDLDLFVANQEGDANGLFRNDAGRFVDVAVELGVDGSRHSPEEGGVGPSLADVDVDGDLELFVANYGENALYRIALDGRFERVGISLGGPPGSHAVASSWADVDNDGRVDLYVTATVNGTPAYPDYLFRNEGGSFSNVLPELVRTHDATHGVQWADFDRDGDVDLALTGNGATDGHYLLRNLLADRDRSLAVDVRDAAGRATLAGAEVRLYRPGTRELLGTRVVDTGSGYCSQSSMPLHFGLGEVEHVDVELTLLGQGGRRVHLVEDVRIGDYRGRALELRAPSRSEPDRE